MTALGVCRFEVDRKAWTLPFMAEPRELAALRRITRIRLAAWGLPHVVEPAELCVSELVTNVITHVGPETPTALTVSMNGARLRIEVADPDTRALPTLMSATFDDEAGRGMALVEAITDRWGVILRKDAKVTWCELRTGLRSAQDHVADPQVDRAEALLGIYCLDEQTPSAARGRAPLWAAEKATVRVIADLLQWLHVHGRDCEAAMESAWSSFGGANARSSS